MTGHLNAERDASRSATIRTDAEDAEILASSVRPDNTSEIETQVDDDRIITTIERETTGGLRTTIDDYVVNLAVAREVVQTANRHADANADTDTHQP
jgi:tRNA threonylcarbamoyladenosine modification (KEOPS) complex  Pcc1 subunit